MRVQVFQHLDATDLLHRHEGNPQLNSQVFPLRPSGVHTLPPFPEPPRQRPHPLLEGRTEARRICGLEEALHRFTAFNPRSGDPPIPDLVKACFDQTIHRLKVLLPDLEDKVPIDSAKRDWLADDGRAGTLYC